MSEPKSCITVVDYFGQKVEACCPHLLIREFSRKEGDNTADEIKAKASKKEGGE